MSLLEDVVHLMRCVLEYFGVPQEMLVPVWESTLCGQYRSIVRMIGSNLPLTPYPRLHFQVPLQPISRRGHIDVSVDAPVIPSLADVLWVAEDEGDSRTKFRNSVSLRKHGWSHGFKNPAAAACVLREQKLNRTPPSSTQPEAFKKIQALEAELLKLQAQIAMIVTTPTDSPLLNIPSTPCSSFPSPVLTSTPFTAPLPPPPPPPPPPLPLSRPPPGVGSEQVSVMDVIRQRQAARKGKAEVREASPAAVPSMLDVLKDLNQVKLRTVERSPGGTPVRKIRSKGTVCATDPAALIAEALKRKFAHRQTFDKENRSAEPSPFSSPDTPQIPVFKRRSQGRNYLSPITRGSDRKQNDGK